MEPETRTGTSSVIVTGATSQIGSFLLPRLVSAGYQVVALSRSPHSSATTDSIDWRQADIGAAATVDWPTAGSLIHIAPLRLLPGLLPGFFAHGGRRVICFGTTSRFSKARSRDAYEQSFAAAQGEAEHQVAELCAAAGAHWTLFRPTLIYGCNMDRNVALIARVIRRFGFFPLFGRASGLRQPVHADDLAAACMAVIDRAEAFDKSYELVGGETLSYREMVERIFASLGRPVRVFRLPMVAFRVALRALSWLPRFGDFNGEMARRMNEDLVFDSSAAARDFAYAPRPFRPKFD
jgi:uncharacterized protein YbjT (DUF2867 family)